MRPVAYLEQEARHDREHINKLKAENERLEELAQGRRELLDYQDKLIGKHLRDYKRLEQEYQLQLAELVRIKENIDKVYRR